MNIPLARFFLFAVVLVAGCENSSTPPAPTPSGGGGSGTGGAALPTVGVVKVGAQKLSKSIRLPGELLAYRNVAIFAKVQGFIDKIHVDRASEVKEGELLAVLMAPEFQDQRIHADAKLASDMATYQRLQQASKTPGVVAVNDVEVAQKLVEADQALIKVYAQNEAYLRITAPFSGVITERNVHEGSLVGPANAQPMLRIQEMARLRLVVYVPEYAVGGIRIGEKVKFTVPAYPGDVFSGTVARPAEALDARMRTMPVELDVDNRDRRLTPAMLTEVHWEFVRATPSLFVPASSVVTTTERRFVVRVKDGQVEWVDVRLGQSAETRVEIFGDISEGDWLALRGTDELRPGTKVTAREPSPGR
jgi:membrane fusion protein (multidrug efflux system)